MAKKPRIPDPATVGRCDQCGKSIGGKGYYGPECICGLPPGDALRGAHGVGTGTARRNKD